MTNKQYEHLGRAVAAEAQIEAESTMLDGLRDELYKHLAAFVPDEVARAWVTKRYGQSLAQWNNGRDFMDAVRQIIADDAKKEKAK